MVNFTIYNKAALVYRLTEGIQATSKKLTFLVGSAFTSPRTAGGFGVPLADDIVSMVRDVYSNNKDALHDFDAAIAGEVNKYQAAFKFLIGRNGQDKANEIIRNAVNLAQITDSVQEPISPNSWYYTEAVSSLSNLLTNHAEICSGMVLTTNFDPILENSIYNKNGNVLRTVLSGDGNINQTSGTGIHIVHLHGFWKNSDTLHTEFQLTQPRPHLKKSLEKLLNNSTLVVCGYGGWDDVINNTLNDISNDDSNSVDILWTHFGKADFSKLSFHRSLASKGRLNQYEEIECDSLFRELSIFHDNKKSKLVQNSSSDFEPEKTVFVSNSTSKRLISVHFDDNPPNTDFFVGRESELLSLKESDYRICAITGIGGQGKSSLAANFFADALLAPEYDYCVWRDCREESERFESHIGLIIEHLTQRTFRKKDIANLDPHKFAEIFIQSTAGKKILFVFDNIDHYLDLDKETFSGALRDFIDVVINSETLCQFIFTSRSRILNSSSNIKTIELKGLLKSEAIDLFDARKISWDVGKIEHIHTLTNGHAFWLDLIAAQVAINPQASVSNLVGSGVEAQLGIPLQTLQSIWESLREREQLVLRALAESVRPYTENEIQKILDGKLNYNKVVKAVNLLKRINLVVIKQTEDLIDTVDLHPLIRHFIKATFPKTERMTFIDAIINFYKITFGVIFESGQKVKIESLANWIECAELYIEGGDLNRASELLVEVYKSKMSDEVPVDLLRVSDLLISRFNWDDVEKNIKNDILIGYFSDDLVEIGKGEKARQLLAKFRETIPDKGSRYVNYCNHMCYLEWFEGNFVDAVSWGERGQSVKDKAGADIRFDASHNLALSRRDCGQVDEALSYFLQGRAVLDVVDPEEVDEQRGGHYYGNIGRCMQLKGDLDSALICYKKSALLLQRSGEYQSIKNRAYIRQWIAEILYIFGEIKLSANFYKASCEKWALISTFKEHDIRSLVDSHPDLKECFDDIADVSAESKCIAWIYGR